MDNVGDITERLLRFVNLDNALSNAEIENLRSAGLKVRTWELKHQTKYDLSDSQIRSIMAGEPFDPEAVAPAETKR